MRVAGRVLGVWAALSTIAVSAAAIDGCVSPTCTETATCPDPGDAIQAQDQSVAADGGPDAPDAMPDSTLDQSSDAAPDGGPDGGDVVQDTASDSQPADAADASEATAPCQCVSGIPSGWSGPGVVFDGLIDASAPSCAAPYSSTAGNANSIPEGPQYGCTCTCGSIDAGCSGPTISVFHDNGCNSTDICTTQQPTTCLSLCPSAGFSAMIMKGPIPNAPSCPPGATATSPIAPSWGRQAEICQYAGNVPDAGCVSDQICAPPAPSGFESSVCIWRAGNVNCPDAGSYQTQRQYFDAWVDTRTCNTNTCSCTASPSVACTLTNVTTYSNSACSVSATSPANELTNLEVDACSPNINNTNGGVVGVTTTVVGSGTCSIAGTPSSTGSVTAGPPAWTLCCTQ